MLPFKHDIYPTEDSQIPANKSDILSGVGWRCSAEGYCIIESWTTILALLLPLNSLNHTAQI